MDRITPLEDALDTLIKVMASAIAYLSRKAGHEQVNARVPLTVLGTTEALPTETLAKNREELVHDLVAQAKEVEQCIQALPTWGDEYTDAALSARLVAKQASLVEANGAYREALEEAQHLYTQLDILLARLCAERQHARQRLETDVAT
ncbi:hypothetical protein MVES_001716 [Malassezia vespertilionis]|uniref:Mediator of RNA polymerase II transcription subunit 21 n=1 Tax=Malassezia vespertilionis TaxID=2020962 RepID=A0A2N1JD17_9BASI|nr:hypothetical protein MVES_001716 [Malassezia vespertilionis]